MCSSRRWKAVQAVYSTTPSFLRVFLAGWTYKEELLVVISPAKLTTARLWRGRAWSVTTLWTEKHSHYTRGALMVSWADMVELPARPTYKVINTIWWRLQQSWFTIKNKSSLPLLQTKKVTCPWISIPRRSSLKFCNWTSNSSIATPYPWLWAIVLAMTWTILPPCSIKHWEFKTTTFSMTWLMSAKRSNISCRTIWCCDSSKCTRGKRWLTAILMWMIREACHREPGPP